MACLQSGPRPLEEGVTGIEQGWRRQRKTEPVEPAPEPPLIGPSVEGDGDPHQVHHGKAGEDQPVEQRTIPLPQLPLCSLRIKRNGCIADSGEVLNQYREADLLRVPAQMEPFSREVDLCPLHSGNRLQRTFNQPDTGRTVDPFDQQVDLSQIPLLLHILGLHLFQVKQCSLFQQFWWWGQPNIIRGPLIEPLHPAVVDNLTDAFTPITAEALLCSINGACYYPLFRNRQPTVETAICMVPAH